MDALVTAKLVIPEELMPALSNGVLIRRGGVIVDSATKRVVKWLDEIPLSQSSPATLAEIATESAANTSIASKLLTIIENHKGAAIGIGIGLIAIGCTIYYVVDQNKQKKANVLKTPDSVLKFKVTFNTYLSEAQLGILSIGTVEKLEKAIQELENDASDNHITLDFSSEDFHKLMCCIIDYTKRLSETNHQEYTLDGTPTNDHLVYLKRCLEAQHEALVSVA